MRNIFKSKCLSRVKSGALAFALMAGLALPCMPMNASAEALPDAAPTITIVAAGVDKKYVEVGLSISGGAAGGIANKFQLAGAVVAYDAKLMQPIEWQPRETNGVASDVPIELPSFVRDASTDMAQVWGTAKAIPTKGDDAFSGKTAIAVVEKTADKEAGYISLYANTTKLEESMAQKVPQGNLVAGAEAAANATVYDLPDAQEAPIPQAVVLRFALKNPAATDAEILAQLTKAIDSVYLMKAVNGVANTREIAEASPIGDSDGAVYFKDVNGEKTAPTVNILRARMAKTFSTGGSGGSATDFASIVFYDWDGTLLGSIVTNKGTDATELVKDFQNSQSATKEQLEDTVANDGDLYYADSKLPLTNKKGYSFLTWIPYDSELLTHCGRALDYANKQTTIEEPTAEQRQDFSNIQGTTAVKACYKDNTDLAYSAVPKDMFYSTNISEYNRVGNSINYSIEVEVNRELDGKGIPRLGQPVLKVTSTTKAGALISFYEITNTDKTTFTFYPSTAVTKVAITVVDFYGATNKALASNKVGMLNENQGTGAGMDGFLWKGTISMINDAAAYENLNLLSAGVLKGQGNLDVAAWGFTAAQAQQSLRAAWLKQNSTDGTEITIKPEKEWQGLTHAQMEYAIKNSGALLAP